MDNVIEKIRKLLALAGSNNDNEARAAIAPAIISNWMTRNSVVDTLIGSSMASRWKCFTEAEPLIRRTL